MNKSVLVVILFFSTVNIFSSCHKYKDENVDVTFEVPLNITPVKDTIQVGDTLTLEANFPDSIKEVTTGKYFKLANFDFKTRVWFEKLVSDTLYISQQPGVISSFNFYPQSGNINNIGTTFASFVIAYADAKYIARIKIIPKQAGIFNIGFYSLLMEKNIILDSVDLGPSDAGGKKIAYLKNIWYTINNGNTNVDLLKQHSKLVSTSTNPNQLNVQQEQKGTYTFVVK